MINKNKSLEKMFNAIQQWINNNKNEFFPLCTNKINPLRSKAIVELAFMCMYYSRFYDINNDKMMANTLSFLIKTIKTPIYRERIIRNPALLSMYGTVYVALRNCGYEDKNLRKMFQTVLNQGYATKIERIGFRKMDLFYLLACGNFEQDISIEKIFSETILSTNPPIIHLLDSDVYSITHTLFYLTDFGRKDISFISQKKQKYIKWLITILLGIYIRERNWDIVGELMIACICIQWYPTTLLNLGWEELIENQLFDGSIPGPSFSLEQYNKLDASNKRTYIFEQNYHTTLVTFMACFFFKNISDLEMIHE